MRHAFPFIVSIYALGFFPLVVHAQEPALSFEQDPRPRNQRPDDYGYSGHIMSFIGVKNLDKNDWSPLENQVEISLLLDGRESSMPVNGVADLRYSFDTGKSQGVSLKGSTFELNLGVRKYFEFQTSGRRWSVSPFTPFIGGGLTLGYGEIEGTLGGITIKDTGYGVGFWIDGGALYTFENGVSLGFEVGYSRLPVKFNDLGARADAGGLRFGIVIGYQF